MTNRTISLLPRLVFALAAAVPVAAHAEQKPIPQPEASATQSVDTSGIITKGAIGLGAALVVLLGGYRDRHNTLRSDKPLVMD